MTPIKTPDGKVSKFVGVQVRRDYLLHYLVHWVQTTYKACAYMSKHICPLQLHSMHCTKQHYTLCMHHRGGKLEIRKWKLMFARIAS